MNEIRLTLHTSSGDEGDVTTSYPASMLSQAWQHFAQYVMDGKTATMTTSPATAPIDVRSDGRTLVIQPANQR